MVFVGTYIKSGDNSGVKLMKCISTLGSSKNTVAKLGDIIKVCLKRARFSILTLKKELAIKKRPLEKKKIYSALVISTKVFTRRRNGNYIRFDNTRALLLTNIMNKKQQYKFIGTRIYGTVCKEIYRPRNYPDLKEVVSHVSTLI